VHIQWFIPVLATPLLVTSCEGVAFVDRVESVDFVDRVEITNDTEYTARVEVKVQTRGWLELTTVAAHDSKEVREVVDLGASWTFSFKHGGHDRVELTLSRQELTNADWRVEVPNEFEEELRGAGVPPPP
jgi:hypothetical protein